MEGSKGQGAFEWEGAQPGETRAGSFPEDERDPKAETEDEGRDLRGPVSSRSASTLTRSPSENPASRLSSPLSPAQNALSSAPGWSEEKDLSPLLEQSLAMVARRARSSSELAQALRKRGEEEGDIDEVLQRLEAAGYLNDSKLAVEVAQSSLHSRLLSPAATKRELLRRGVDQEQAKLAVEEALGNASVSELCNRALQARLKSQIPDQKTALRHARALARGGWDEELIKQALGRLAPGVFDEW